jgi:hypothetical protein
MVFRLFNHLPWDFRLTLIRIHTWAYLQSVPLVGFTQATAASTASDVQPVMPLLRRLSFVSVCHDCFDSAAVASHPLSMLYVISLCAQSAVADAATHKDEKQEEEEEEGDIHCTLPPAGISSSTVEGSTAHGSDVISVGSAFSAAHAPGNTVVTSLATDGDFPDITTPDTVEWLAGQNRYIVQVGGLERIKQLALTNLFISGPFAAQRCTEIRYDAD